MEQIHVDRRDFLKQTLMTAGVASLEGAAQGEPTRPLPWVAEPAYYDATVPRKPEQISVSPFRGSREEQTVPDTLDLVDYAEKALNVFTRMISPLDTDYCIYHLVHAAANPLVFEIGHGSNQNQNAKWSEAVVMMRAMTGDQSRL